MFGVDGGTVVRVRNRDDCAAGNGDPSVDAIADVAGAGASNDRPDGTIDGADFIAFINAFGGGC